jgi:hypothetical protein
MLANHLQTCQGNKLVVSELENPVKAGHRKDTSGCRGNAAEDKPMSAISQKLAQLQELRDTGRSYNIDAGKVNYNLAVTSITHHPGDRRKLISHFRLLGQVHKNNILRPILNPHLNLLFSKKFSLSRFIGISFSQVE